MADSQVREKSCRYISADLCTSKNSRCTTLQEEISVTQCRTRKSRRQIGSLLKEQIQSWQRSTGRWSHGETTGLVRNLLGQFPSARSSGQHRHLQQVHPATNQPPLVASGGVLLTTVPREGLHKMSCFWEITGARVPVFLTSMASTVANSKEM